MSSTKANKKTIVNHVNYNKEENMNTENDSFTKRLGDEIRKTEELLKRVEDPTNLSDKQLERLAELFNELNGHYDKVEKLLDKLEKNDE